MWMQNERFKTVIGVGDERLENYLQSLETLDVIHVAPNREEFLAAIAEHKPELALFAYVLPGDLDIVNLPDAIRRHSPLTRVIWVLNEYDPAFAEQCNAVIAAGFYDILSRQLRTSQLRDVIATPMRYEDVAHLHTGDDLVPETTDTKEEQPYVAGHIIRSIQAEDEGAVSGERHGLLRPLTVAVWSPKAGSGSTTIATRLALTAESQGLDVALYDFNLLHSHAVFHLGIEMPEGLEEFLSSPAVEIDWDTVRRTFVKHKNLSIFPGLPRMPEMASKIGANWMEAIMANTREQFTLSIFDLHPDIDQMHTFMALKRCTVILVVVTQDPTCLHEAKKQLFLLRRLNVPFRKLRLVVNRFVSGVRNLDETDIGEFLGLPVVTAIPENYKDFLIELRDREPKASKKPYHVILEHLYGQPIKQGRRLRLFSSHAR